MLEKSWKLITKRSGNPACFISMYCILHTEWSSKCHCILANLVYILAFLAYTKSTCYALETRFILNLTSYLVWIVRLYVIPSSARENWIGEHRRHKGREKKTGNTGNHWRPCRIQSLCYCSWPCWINLVHVMLASGVASWHSISLFPFWGEHGKGVMWYFQFCPAWLVQNTWLEYLHHIQ